MNPQDQASQEQQPVADKAAVWAELDAADTGATAAPAQSASQEQAAPQDTAAAPAQPAAEKAASEQGAAGDDPYAGVPETVKNEITGLRHMVDTLAGRLRNAEGHIGGLNSKLQAQAQAAAAQTRAEGGEAPSAAQLRGAQGDAKAMAKLLEEYPEFGAAMQEALEGRIGELRNEFKSMVPAAPAAPGVTAEQLERVRSEMSVESKHPGWQETVKTPAFRGWLLNQPREFHMLAASDAPQDAIRLLDVYSQNGKQGATRQQRLDAAAALPTGRATAARVKPVEHMSKAELWAHLDNIESQPRT